MRFEFSASGSGSPPGLMEEKANLFMKMLFLWGGQTFGCRLVDCDPGAMGLGGCLGKGDVAMLFYSGQGEKLFQLLCFLFEIGSSFHLLSFNIQESKEHRIQNSQSSFTIYIYTEGTKEEEKPVPHSLNAIIQQIDLFNRTIAMSELVLSGGFRFPVPLPNLMLSEKKAIERLHGTRVGSSHFHIGQASLSNRMTIVLSCYLLKVLHSCDQDQGNFFYLCKTQERRIELMHALAKLEPFVANWFKQNQPDDYKKELRVYGEAEDYETDRDGKRGRSRTLTVLTSRQYLQHRLEMHEFNYWEQEKTKDLCMEANRDNFSHFHKLMGRIDFMLMETNDVEGLLEDVFTVHLSEVHIIRGWSQCQKLQKFYNFRVEAKGKDRKLTQTDKDRKARQENKLKDTKEINKVEKSLQQRKEMSSKVSSWKIEVIDQKMKALSQKKIESLRYTDYSAYVTTGSQLQFLECYLLMHLETIFYMCNYLMVEINSLKYKEHQTAAEFLSHFFNQVHLRSIDIKKLRKILLNFIQLYPPVIRGRELSTFYLRQVLELFEKLVVWHEIYESPQANDKFIMLRYAKELNPASIIKEPHGMKEYKEQQIRLTTFDDKLLMKMLTEGVKGFCCFQNHSYSEPYYEKLFRFEKRPEYFCPVKAFKEMQNKTIGMIVNSTPNDEDLMINSYKMSSKEDLVEGEEKKEADETYCQLIRSYGVMIFDLCETVPDGIVVYFPSKEIMRQCRSEWESKENIYQKIYQKKKIFEEDELESVNQQNVAAFRKRCELSRGAIFFVSAQSQFSKYQTFFRNYSRCVIFVGVPYPSIREEIEAKFLTVNFKLEDKSKMHLFCFEEAMRVVTRCLSNCCNDPDDLKLLILADAGFRSERTISKWLPLIEESSLNTTTAVERVAFWLKHPQETTSHRTKLRQYMELVKKGHLKVRVKPKIKLSCRAMIRSQRSASLEIRIKHISSGVFKQKSEVGQLKMAQQSQLNKLQGQEGLPDLDQNQLERLQDNAIIASLVNDTQQTQRLMIKSILDTAIYQLEMNEIANQLPRDKKDQILKFCKESNVRSEAFLESIIRDDSAGKVRLQIAEESSRGVILERVFFGMLFLVVLQGEVFRRIERDQNRDKGFSEVLEGTEEEEYSPDIPGLNDNALMAS